MNLEIQYVVNNFFSIGRFFSHLFVLGGAGRGGGGGGAGIAVGKLQSVDQRYLELFAWREPWEVFSFLLNGQSTWKQKYMFYRLF